jgi:hypothetical protein
VPGEASAVPLGALLIAPTVLIFCAVIVYPLVSALYLSLFSIYTPTLKGKWVGFDNYTALLASGEFWNAFWVNVVWTVGTLFLQIVLGVALALLLHQNIIFRSLARSLILFPYFMSTVVPCWCGVGVQRPLRHPQPRHDVDRPLVDADRLGRPDAQCHDQRHPGRRLEVFPLRRDQRAGPPADHPRPSLRGRHHGRRRRLGPLLRHHPAALRVLFIVILLRAI